jgi:hypothetical protein
MSKQVKNKSYNTRDYSPKIRTPKCFCTGGDPKPSLVLEDLKEDGGRGTLVVKDSRVTLLPNRPTNMHGDGRHSFTVVGGYERHPRPPIF